MTLLHFVQLLPTSISFCRSQHLAWQKVRYSKVPSAKLNDEKKKEVLESLANFNRVPLKKLIESEPSKLARHWSNRFFM